MIEKSVTRGNKRRRKRTYYGTIAVDRYERQNNLDIIMTWASITEIATGPVKDCEAANDVVVVHPIKQN